VPFPQFPAYRRSLDKLGPCPHDGHDLHSHEPGRKGLVGRRFSKLTWSSQLAHNSRLWETVALNRFRWATAINVLKTQFVRCNQLASFGDRHGGMLLKMQGLELNSKIWHSTKS